MGRHIVLLLLMLLVNPSQAMEPKTEHTWQLEQGEKPPTATLEDVAWLSGDWLGTAFGSQFEEVWNPPSAGSMVGFFKLMNGNEVNFYELMTLTVDDGRLSLKVKHFSSDFTAWEDKSEYVNFKLVGLEDNAVHFAGISFYRINDNQIDGYIVMKGKDGISEEKLTYRRRNTRN